MISLLLCTVRPDAGYLDHPDWHTIGKVLEDLEAQTHHDFELVVVDGLHAQRQDAVAQLAARCSFPVVHIPPDPTLWTTHKKVCISGYRNSGLRRVHGQLVCNLDDCCVLPPIYVEVLARVWKEHGLCGALTWPAHGDSRKPGRVTGPGQVFGFGSYPLEAALNLNGYDEAYDGCQGLEDIDWSTRLFSDGVPMVLLEVPGFRIERQSGHSPLVIDAAEPLVKCCNAAWQTQRVWRQVRVANRPELWSREALERLVGPCHYLMPNRTCAHHFGRHPCAYLERGFVEQLHPLAAELFANPPVFDLKAARHAVQGV